MQGCCPHRGSPSSPRKIAAEILGAKSFQKMPARPRPSWEYPRPHPGYPRSALRQKLPVTVFAQGCSDSPTSIVQPKSQYRIVRDQGFRNAAPTKISKTTPCKERPPHTPLVKKGVTGMDALAAKNNLTRGVNQRHDSIVAHCLLERPSSYLCTFDLARVPPLRSRIRWRYRAKRLNGASDHHESMSPSPYRRRLIAQQTPLSSRVANHGQEAVIQGQRRTVEQSTRPHTAAKKRHVRKHQSALLFN